MMKIDRFTFLFLLDGIVALFALLFGTSMNVRMAAAIAAVTIVLILISIYTIYDHRLSLSSVLLLYTIATQFGLVMCRSKNGDFLRSRNVRRSTMMPLINSTWVIWPTRIC